MEEAAGGTLFMDEIANLPLEVQAKIMCVLRENEIRSQGNNQVCKINVRSISASIRYKMKKLGITGQYGRGSSHLD